MFLRNLLGHRVEDRRQLRELVASRQVNAVRELTGPECACGQLQALQSRTQTSHEQYKDGHRETECEREAYECGVLDGSFLGEGAECCVRDLLIATFDLAAHGLGEHPVGLGSELDLRERCMLAAVPPHLVYGAYDVPAMGEEVEHRLCLDLYGLHQCSFVSRRSRHRPEGG